jgi:hypothetical protein
MLRPLAVAVLLAAPGALPLAAQEDPPPRVTAAELLGARAAGPHHRVADAVDAEGYYYRFDLRTDFGDMPAEGLSLLDVRLRELDALVQLEQVSKGEVFARAAGGAVVQVGRGVVSVVKDPVGTAKGIGGGLRRFGINLGRKAKRAAADVKDAATTTDEERARAMEQGPDPRSGGEKAKDAAGGAANALFGVNSAARRWARKLGVDPYTTNPVLAQALRDFGKVDAAGGIAAKIALPIPPLATTTADVGELVWGADPEEVRKVNEARARELHVAPEVANALWRSDAFTLTAQTRLIAALHAVKPEAAASWVATAVEAEDEREALFHVESAEMMRRLDRERPAAALLPDNRTLVVRSGGTAIALLPVDHVRWTADFAEQARELAQHAKAELRASRVELRVSGTVSERARRGLAGLGYVVREGEPLS